MHPVLLRFLALPAAAAAFWSEVCLVVEVWEKNDHDKTIKDAVYAKPVMDVAKGGEYETNEKLRDLKLGQPRLPFHDQARIPSGHSIVEIQEHVNRSVDWQNEGNARPRIMMIAIVTEQEHGTVVIHMKEGDLAALVAQHHKDSIEELCDFCQPVYKE